MNPNLDFSRRLIKALDRAGVSRDGAQRKKWLADACDVTPRHAGNYLNGAKLPTTGGLMVLAQALGVAYEWLTTGRGPMLPLDLSEEQAAALLSLDASERDRLFAIANVLHSANLSRAA